MTYEEYISSEAWRQKRLERIAIDNGECRTCCSKDQLEVHHRHYKSLFNEQMDDLITLCSECHEAITCVIRARRYAAIEIVPKKLSQREITYANQQAKPETNWIGSTNCPLKPPRRPIGTSHQAIEANIIEAVEDRCRPRSDG